ncbi:hypothetical protein [Amycolatopsis anabasis]|uniref:hypothetical protein n=1 Tax=Amycolatopsis anabasis TaxID=1840409 RepID=UPI00131EAC30|nr:hypothetical protein [Amycolatopsis anabasis]
MPEPILISIAAALGGKAAAGLYELIKKKFAKQPDAIAALEAAKDAPRDSEPVRALAERLETAGRADPEFAKALRTEAERAEVHQHAETGGVTNHISGNVTGPVVQARDIHGGIKF